MDTLVYISLLYTMSLVFIVVNIIIMIRGDTGSFNCNYKFRMDLRLLCRSLNKSYDYCNGELARIINDMMYYDDKKKLCWMELSNWILYYKAMKGTVMLWHVNKIQFFLFFILDWIFTNELEYTLLIILALNSMFQFIKDSFIYQIISVETIFCHLIAGPVQININCLEIFLIIVFDFRIIVWFC